MHRVLIFDLETTCWETDYPVRSPEIIEYGGVVIDPYGSQEASWTTFVRPLDHPYLSSFCSKLTGITQDDVQDAEPFPTFYDQWSSWLSSLQPIDYFIAWGAYDLKVWQQHCAYYNRPLMDDSRYLDLKRAYHAVFNPGQMIGLKKAHRREGLIWDGPVHRALPDAVHLAELYLKHMGDWPMA